jgi:hypothetical protein
MRKNPTYKEQINDGIHANVALYAIYLAAFASGFKFVCLGSFLSIILNSVYMWTIWDKAYAPEAGEDNSLDTSTDNEDTEDSEDTQEINENLSLKQREQGATLAKPMDEEDEIILNSRFQQIVEDTRRRNEERLNTIPRTPTNTSLNDLTNDEFEDMPPLISMYNKNISFNQCSTCIHHYNNLIPANSVYISTVRELVTPSKNTVLHGMYEVD